MHRVAVFYEGFRRVLATTWISLPSSWALGVVGDGRGGARHHLALSAEPPRASSRGLGRGSVPAVRDAGKRGPGISIQRIGARVWKGAGKRWIEKAIGLEAPEDHETAKLVLEGS